VLPRPCGSHDQLLNVTQSSQTEIVVGAIGGVVIGYILWLIGVSIGVTTATTATWSVVILIISLLAGVVAWVGGWRLRRRRLNTWAAFVVGLPILPVVLSLCVITVAYL
jgi:Ca2+/Na+ antiporter